jgi:hypothetical protein
MFFTSQHYARSAYKGAPLLLELKKIINMFFTSQHAQPKENMEIAEGENVHPVLPLWSEKVN